MGGHGEDRKWEHMGKGKTYMGRNEKHGRMEVRGTQG